MAMDATGLSVLLGVGIGMVLVRRLPLHNPSVTLHPLISLATVTCRGTRFTPLSVRLSP